MINSAMFARNGRCGYVLKPDILTTKSKDVDWVAQPFKVDVKVSRAVPKCQGRCQS